MKHGHPMQVVEWDGFGVVRFRANEIVRYLLDHGGLDLNALHGLGRPDMPEFSKEDWTQFAQLIGYSVSGFGDLDYVEQTAWARAFNKQTRLLQEQPKDPKKKRSTSARPPEKT